MRPERALGRPAVERYKRYSTGGLYTGPFFDPTSPNNITTQLGTHAYLPCKVKQLGNKSVSIATRINLSHQVGLKCHRQKRNAVKLGVFGR